MEALKHELGRFNKLTFTPYRLESDVIPINKLKNLGIQAVSTTHYLFAELNLVPSSSLSPLLSPAESLYRVLKATPGYLWRDPYFVGRRARLRVGARRLPRGRAQLPALLFLCGEA